MRESRFSLLEIAGRSQRLEVFEGQVSGEGSYVLHLSLVEVGDDGQPGSSPISALDDTALYSSGRPICSGFDSRPFHFQ